MSDASVDSQPSTAFLLQSAKPALQTNAHAPAVQLGVAFAGVGHTAQDAPHAVTSFAAAHLPLHAWKSG